VRHSHPEWLVARWLERYGEADTERWLAFNNRPPRLCLAVNRLRGTREQLAGDLAREGVETEPTARSAHGLHVVTGAALSTDAFRQGRFIVQDEASQLIAQLGDVHAGQRVLDLCASPGGKTLALAARMGSTGALVACDVRPRRVRLLQQTVDRLGIPASVVRISADEAAPFADGAFDYVLVDAPCSGLGTLRRDPDIRWARTVDDLARLAGAQRRLLARAARLVAPGGTLVYATCSSEPDENQDVVAAHLAEDGRLRLEDVHVTTPVGDGLEAFYGAVLRRDV
jgi:16S rRNA (cytosine967-C5)-methyltransferase